ncbi:MAG: ABC transporter substrate-binding protein, partial [Deltaproteobacteria bacterium]|nr:ABC transporter substrate-binding protein [Deltaproteobacteria bacterium]
MYKDKGIRLVIGLTLVALVLGACARPTPTPTAAPTVAPPTPTAAPTVAPATPTAAAPPCPASTVANPMGLEGKYPYQFELAEYEEKAGCKMVFSENPDIADLNARITGNPDLPPLEERLPEEPLVIQPYYEIGVYGGVLDGLSNATEAGTVDLLSIRHVNLLRISDDLKTVVPNVAKGWKWNEDFTELTFFLRKGHKWSDGQPFTAEDIEFWYNDLILNKEIYPETPSRWVFGGEPMKVTAVDETTVRFEFAVPTPGFVHRLSVDYFQPFQPKRFFEKEMEETGKSLAEVADIYYGGSDWKDVPSPLLKGMSDHVVPTLEAFIVVEDTTKGRRVVANPYFHMVDTAGNQLPYINEINEVYAPEKEVRLLKITSGEVDYKAQALFFEDYSLLKENEARGNYTVDMAADIGGIVWFGFNVNHKDPEMRKIFNGLRFRQAMSLALDREEIAEIVYLGRGVPQQATPVDHMTVSFVTEEHLNSFIEYDPDRANALLDEMGLVDTDGDGFRERLDGSKFVILYVYDTLETPVRVTELVRGYWEDIGVAVKLKEVTADERRAMGSANYLDVIGIRMCNTTPMYVISNPNYLVPPFGDYFVSGPALEWAKWHDTGGAEGIEPPEDVKRLYELVEDFLKHELGSEESNRIGREITDIHVKNLWKIGVVGDIGTPVVHSNNLGNFRPFDVWTGAYD